jgi:hypothetical protein
MKNINTNMIVPTTATTATATPVAGGRPVVCSGKLYLMLFYGKI